MGAEIVIDDLQNIEMSDTHVDRLDRQDDRELRRSKQLEFLLTVLQSVDENNGNPDIIYPLLCQNLDLLDLGIIDILRNWVNAKFAEVDRDKQRSIAINIVNFGNLIQQFRRGNKAVNMELSIECYRAALKVYTRTIKDYKQTLQQWGLKDNPFDFTPPDEFAQVAKIFHGRSQELEIALPTLYEGRNVLIRGKWGIGKTALMKTLLYRLQQEVSELKETMLVLYLGGIPKPTVIDFYRAVLLAVTKSIAQHNDSWHSEEAKKVADSLSGLPIDSIKIKQEGGINLGIFGYKISSEPNSTSGGENDVYQQLLYWLKEAAEIYGKLLSTISTVCGQNPVTVSHPLRMKYSIELSKPLKAVRASSI
jgi:hypothetical protein